MTGRFGNLWTLLKPHARPRLPVLALVLLLGSVTAYAQAAVLVLFVPIWNRVFFPGEGSEVGEGQIDWLFNPLWLWAERSDAFADPRITMLVALSGIAVLMAIIGALAQWAYTWFARKVGLQMIVDLRVRLARHLMGLSMRYHSQRKFGDLLSRVSADVGATLVAVEIGLKSLLLQPLMALALIIGMFVMAPIPSLVILLGLPIALWPISKLAKRVRKGSMKSLTSLGASVQALSQMFQGIRTVKSFGGEERELRRYRALNEGYLKNSMKMVRAIALSHAWSAFYGVAGIALLMLIMGWIQLTYGIFPDGGYILGFFMMVGRLNNHVKSYMRALTSVEECAGAAERIQAILDEPAEVVESPDPLPARGLGSGIRFEKVTFTYPGSETPAIEDLELEVRPGETLALVGHSGAGKSTLVDLVARFIDPSAGTITVDNKDLRDLSISDWTSLYAMVGQVPFLFHATIGENIAYGKEGASQAEIEEAARVAGLHEFIQGLPDGYDTDVADMGSRLSGGQRQRITIARAVLKGAPLLLLDEATSALDSESEAEVQKALERLMKDRTVIVIAHRLSTVQNANRVAVLEDGRLVELGTHAELLAHKGTYARLSALQNLEAPSRTASRG